MAEILFANLSKTGMQLSTVTGASGTLTNLEIVGTHSGDTTVDTRQVKVNGVSQISGNHGTARGMYLVIFNEDMSVSYYATFDIYGTESARNALADKLKTITATQIGVLCSCDSISSNAGLDETMNYFRSNAWPGITWFNKPSDDVSITDRRRTSYAAIICGRKRAVVAEKFVGHGVDDGEARIQVSFADPTRIGYNGFGKPIIDDTGEDVIVSSGNTELIERWIDSPLDDLNLKVGDEYLFKSLAEINAISASSSTYILYMISYYNGNTLNGEQSRKVTCVEGWQEVEIRHKIPTDCNRIVVDVSQRRDPHPASKPTGTTYVKNTVMSLADNTQQQTTGVSIGVNGTSANRFEDSLGNFGQYDPDGYYEAYKSESNLLKDLPITQHVNEPVRWMNKVIDNDNERLVIKTTGDQKNASSIVNIDPSKMYYCSVWVNKQVKTSGEFMLGFLSMDASGEFLELRRTDSISGTGKSVHMYSQMPPHDYLEERQWYLLQGFLLPYNISQEDANAFVEANKEFYGWDDIYGNGIGVSDEGSGYYGWINNSNCIKGNLTFLDYNNNGNSSISAWSLPIIREVKLGSIDIDNSFISSLNLS